MRGGEIWEVQMRRRMKAGSAASREEGRYPGVSQLESQSRQRGSTLPQAKAEGVPTKPSTFSGVVYNGPKPGGAARAGREHELALPACTHRYGGVSHSARVGTSPTKPWHGAEVVVVVARYWKRQ